MTRETLKAWPPDSVWCTQADLAKRRWPTSSSPSRGQPRWLWRGSVGDASASATAQPSGREGIWSPRWDGKQSPGAVLSATRHSSLSKPGMKTVTAKSHCARASGSPRGCSPPSSLPLCGSVMTFCTVILGMRPAKIMGGGSIGTENRVKAQQHTAQ